MNKEGATGRGKHVTVVMHQKLELIWKFNRIWKFSSGESHSVIMAEYNKE